MNAFDDMTRRTVLASPCSVNWDDMTGDEKSRVCAQCDLSVLNASAMTGEEVMMAIMSLQSGKRVCMRIYRRHDGTILTRDCPIGLRKKVAAGARRAAAWLAGGLSMLLSVAANAQQTAGSGDANCTDKTAGKKPLWHSQVVADETSKEKKGKQTTGTTAGSVNKAPVIPMPGMIGPPQYTAADVAAAKTEIVQLEKTKGAQSAEVAQRVKALAMMYYWQHNYADSKATFLRALDMFEKLGARNEMRNCATQLQSICIVTKDPAGAALWEERAETYFPIKPKANKNQNSTPDAKKGTP